MILFFRSKANKIYAVGSVQPLQKSDIQKLIWLFNGGEPLAETVLSGFFIGPRKEMITPWSTNAVEITQNMEIPGIQRIEEFSVAENASAKHDRMLEVLYTKLDQDLFTIRHTPQPIVEIDNIAAYSEKEGLALSKEEIDLSRRSKQTTEP
jgi:phosphoribosylformylglycinamidine synthase